VVVIVKDWSAGERRHTKLAKGVSLDSQEMLERMGESLIELALSRVASEHDPPRTLGGVKHQSLHPAPRSETTRTGGWV
jgi:hypothetical protein